MIWYMYSPLVCPPEQVRDWLSLLKELPFIHIVLIISFMSGEIPLFSANWRIHSEWQFICYKGGKHRRFAWANRLCLPYYSKQPCHSER